MEAQQRRSLVTGATGYLGSWLTQSLLADGHAVTIIARPGPKLDNLKFRFPQLSIIAADDTEGLADAVAAAGPQTLFHLAAERATGEGVAETKRMIASNIAFAALVLEATMQAGCRVLVNAGTQSQHRTGMQAYAPTDLYAACKQAFQDIVAYYTDLRGLKAVHLKLSDVYGPADPRKRVLDLLIDAQITGQPLALTAGIQEIDFIHVDDAVRAFRAAAQALHNGVGLAPACSVASRRLVTLRDLAAMIEKIGGRPIDVRWGAKAYGPGALMRPWIGPDKLPGWEARIRLEDGLTSMIEAARRMAEPA